METIDAGCRLCLDPVAEKFCSLNNPEFKEKLDMVFNFPVSSKSSLTSGFSVRLNIEQKDECSNTICKACWNTITDFFLYSEQVRINQENLMIKVEPKDELTEIEHQQITGTDNDTSNPYSKDEDDADNEENSDDEVCSAASNSSDEKPSKLKRQGIKKTAKHGCLDLDANSKKWNKPTKEKLEQMDQQIEEYFKMVCDICGDFAKNFLALQEHFQMVHDKAGYIVCCKKKLFARRYLFEHLTFHKNPTAFQCEVCQKNFKTKDYMRNHMANSHAIGKVRQYKCVHCKLSFAKQQKLDAHLQTHEKVPCPHCKKLLKGAFSLKVHITNLHSDKDRRMICDTCGREFLSKIFFERHIQEHMGIDPVKKFQCQICLSWLKGERGLQEHMQHSHYEKSQTFFCDICNRKVANYRALQKHKRRVHAERKFACEFCDRKFNQPIALKEHRAVHTGEVLYTCDYCERTSKKKSNLYTHVKKVHPVEWAEKRRLDAEARIPKS
ncbi:transcription factor grauzone-like [Sabethes cyaneus]|uniref:transcription factor grauzone-like n=1 Tax=Sabethes cyaneus TaxID=53552 RepID=UPI00237E9525|nr:transcription factor grauzone-like [Sabethes cyaneus]